MHKAYFLAALYAVSQTSAIAASDSIISELRGKKILFVERHQYAIDHHNTANLFQFGEINDAKFNPGAALKIFDYDSKKIKTLLETQTGVLRDPEISFDGTKVLFSMRKSREDDYHIYEMNVDGTSLRQITFAQGVSDIDPLYLPDGDILFSSTREPKYCMCNRHIMANLYRMKADGSNITQLGVSTLFEGHASLLNDGRVLYDRWEYVDRNFGDAQGLWTMNPDGTKHAIYYGNNTPSPGGVIDARAIPGSSNVVCIFGSCHDLAWGAFTILDRRKGVDGVEAVVDIWPKDSRKFMRPLDPHANLDSFKGLQTFYEDPFPLDEDNFLVSRSVWLDRPSPWRLNGVRMGLVFISTDGREEVILEGDQSLFDPILVASRFKPNVIPTMRNFEDNFGRFYVQNVYEGTHMQGVEKGAAKYLRIVESPPKRSWSQGGWHGEGEQAPAVNWHSFEVKRVLGVVPIEKDGSASFEAPAGKHIYFQLLDKDGKMIHSMRSGISLMPGETNGCIGCHEDRLDIPPATSPPMALRKAPVKLDSWLDQRARNFSFMEQVQPILDNRCVRCHDFDPQDRSKLVLSRDKNPYFNAAYINLYVKKSVHLVGGGPAAIQDAYSWGSHKSLLTQIIDEVHPTHQKVNLTQEERRVLYTWMDINGVYYPTYESAFDNTVAGRSPLTHEELKELKDLTGIDFFHGSVMNGFRRKHLAQISFERPELSPCLDSVRHDAQKFDRAVAIIKTGAQRLYETPRGDIESQLVLSERNKEQLRKYASRLSKELQNSCKIDLEENKKDLR